MTITGGIKFFERSTSLFSAGTVAVSTSNSASANNILTNRQLTYLQSIGSDDLTAEIITVTYNKTVTIDRVILNRMNFKQFTVKYDVSSAWTDFTTVIGLDGALGGGISETDFSDETAYYEVDSISTTGIQIEILKTQAANAEKIIYNLFTTAELGTLEYPPQITGDFNRKSREAEVLSGLVNMQKAFEVNNISLEFISHPSQSDMNLISTLFDEENSFLVWLCGGKRGTTSFRFDIKGYGLRDVYNMQIAGGIAPNYPGSIYVTAPNNIVNLRASV